MKHVVMFSGGVGSWMAAQRVAAQYGTADLTLLFADTLIEDPDLYRFLDDAAAQLGVPVTRIADGRDPWQVFHDVRFLGNSQTAPCSRLLKQEPATAWLDAHCDPGDTVCYVGIDWTESHRFAAIEARRRDVGWTYRAPLCEPPLLMKLQMLDALRAAGLTPPRLYALGFSHNNCGGFCVRAGQGHFARLLRVLPDTYAAHEAAEAALRATLGKDVAILSDRRGDNVKKPLTLRAFRAALEAGQSCDLFDIGGCGCLTEA